METEVVRAKQSPYWKKSSEDDDALLKLSTTYAQCVKMGGEADKYKKCACCLNCNLYNISSFHLLQLNIFMLIFLKNTNFQKNYWKKS